MKQLPILSEGTNAKTILSDLLGEYLTGIVYLSPHKLSGVNFCGFATNGCKKACLNTAGRGRMSNVQKGRLRKSLLFINNRAEFFEQLIKDIEKHVRKATKKGLKPAIRLNGTSDLPWENIKHKGKTILEHFPNVQFYDYTKNPNRMKKTLPENYDLTYSFNEDTDPLFVMNEILPRHRNVAVVFRDKLPKTFLMHEVVNGDEHDLRFTDRKGVIVGLKAKGDAKKDKSGFVIDC